MTALPTGADMTANALVMGRGNASCRRSSAKRDIDRCVMRGLKGREMEIERADPDRIEVLGGKPGDKERYIESDFRIRSGLCPNGHGLMTMGGWGQECPTCGFTCNTMPDTPNGADA